MITLKSHGFKFSRPEANIVFDVSYFANPWREKDIREEKDAYTRKQRILEFIRKQPGAYEFAQDISTVIQRYYELFPGENIIVALCCSAGEYRSPAMVEMVNLLLSKNVDRIIKHSENSKI